MILFARAFYAIIWGCCRFFRQTLNIIYMRTIGSCAFIKIGHNTIFDGLPDIIYPFSNIKIGNYCRFGKNCVIYSSRQATIVIGNNTTINNNCHITSQASICIGNNVLIAENVGIRDHNHGFSCRTKLIRDQPYDSSPIIIGDNVWIGRCATILKGVTIGEGAVIGAGSVVNKDVAPHSVNAGVPSRLIRLINP